MRRGGDVEVRVPPGDGRVRWRRWKQEVEVRKKKEKGGGVLFDLF